MREVVVFAKDRHDLGALIECREALEEGADEVRVIFPNYDESRLAQHDLPAIRQKIIYSM